MDIDPAAVLAVISEQATRIAALERENTQLRILAAETAPNLSCRTCNTPGVFGQGFCTACGDPSPLGGVTEASGRSSVLNEDA